MAKQGTLAPNKEKGCCTFYQSVGSRVIVPLKGKKAKLFIVHQQRTGGFR